MYDQIQKGRQQISGNKLKNLSLFDLKSGGPVENYLSGTSDAYYNSTYN